MGLRGSRCQQASDVLLNVIRRISVVAEPKPAPVAVTRDARGDQAYDAESPPGNEQQVQA